MGGGTGAYGAALTGIAVTAGGTRTCMTEPGIAPGGTATITGWPMGDCT